MPRNHKRGFTLNVRVHSKKKRARTENVKVTCGPAAATSSLAPIRNTRPELQQSLYQTPCIVSEQEHCETDKRDYSCKRDKVCEDWAVIREKLMQAALASEIKQSVQCIICGENTDEPIRCEDCYPLFICCGTCEEKHHAKLLHKPEIWKESIGMFVPYCGAAVKIWRINNHNCNTGHISSMELIDIKGRKHLVDVTYCECESLAESLVRCGFWPSSPSKPTAAFNMELLKMLHILTMECAISVTGFVNALRWNNNLSEKEAKHLYGLLIGDTVGEYRFFYRQMQMSTNPMMTRTVKCLACPQTKGTLTVSLDGNFGLVRKKNSGSNLASALHQNAFFMNAESVHDFVEKYQHGQLKDNECSNFLAGDVIRSKAKNARLDIRGVFGSVCRHEHPVLFVDMKFGERLGYPISLLQQLVQSCAADVTIQIIYDIGCVLKRHLCTNNEELLRRIDIAVPVFHAYGHDAACQASLSCRHKENFGLTDGEGTERLWSYLRKFAATTKEMTTCHRTDFLTEALFHYTVKKTYGLPSWLEMRAERACCMEKETSSKLNEFADECKGDTYLLESLNLETVSSSSQKAHVTSLSTAHIQTTNSWIASACQAYRDLMILLRAGKPDRSMLLIRMVSASGNGRKIQPQRNYWSER